MVGRWVKALLERRGATAVVTVVQGGRVAGTLTFSVADAERFALTLEEGLHATETPPESPLGPPVRMLEPPPSWGDLEPGEQRWVYEQLTPEIAGEGEAWRGVRWRNRLRAAALEVLALTARAARRARAS